MSSKLSNEAGFIHGTNFFGSFLSVQTEFKINVFDDLEYLYDSPYFLKQKNQLYQVEDNDEDKLLFSDTRNYRKKINKILSSNSETCIGVDVMVGFPGESDEDFLETYNFINDIDISYLHVFTYSERPNTPAKNIKEVISKRVRAERSKMLHILSEKKRRYFYDHFINTHREVLFESSRNGKLVGHTDNYIKVEIDNSPGLVNKIHSVKLIENRGEFDMGEL